MKKLLLTLLFLVSPLVAMDSGSSTFDAQVAREAFREGTAVCDDFMTRMLQDARQGALVELYAKNWPDLQSALSNYCDAPDDRYERLFEKMAEEAVGLMPGLMKPFVGQMLDRFVGKERLSSCKPHNKLSLMHIPMPCYQTS